MAVDDLRGWPPAGLRSLDEILRALEQAERIDRLDELRRTLIALVGEMIDHDELAMAARRGAVEDVTAPEAAPGAAPPADAPRRRPWLEALARLGRPRDRAGGASADALEPFVALLDATPYPAAFHDSARLPRPKEEIIVAIAERLTAELDPASAELLRNLAHRLSFYQSGVGRRPLHAGGMRVESYDPRPGRHQFSSAITADAARARLYDACLRRQADDLRRFEASYGVAARPGGEPPPDSFYLA